MKYISLLLLLVNKVVFRLSIFLAAVLLRPGYLSDTSLRDFNTLDCEDFVEINFDIQR